MIKLVISDLDGTIIDSNNKICEDNYKAIDFINSVHIPFVLCTGKTYSVYKGLCKNLNADYGIFGNGSLIVNLKTEEKIYESLLTKKDIIKIIGFAKSNNLHVHLYADNQIITEELLYLDLRNYKLQKKHIYINKLEFKIVPDLLEYAKTHSLNTSNVVISSEKSLDNFKKLLSKNINLNILHIQKTGKYKDLIINKNYEYLNLSPKNVNKNNALTILCKNLNISQKEVLAVGDNLNDIDMIKNSGIGIAVQNAYSELKEVSDYITINTVDQGGFAESIYKFLKTE